MSAEGQVLIQRCTATVIQDLGRFGYVGYGIPTNGAADRFAYLAGQALLACEQPLPAIEITAFDFLMSVSRDLDICITGAPADVLVGGREAAMWETLRIHAGEALRVSHIRRGLRVYIAFAARMVVPIVLGSCSWDSVSQLGIALYSGQEVDLVDVRPPLPAPRTMPLDAIPDYGTPWSIHVSSGPDHGRFPKSLEQLLDDEYMVSPQSNHVGIRLEGPAFSGVEVPEQLSRGVGAGAVELLPSGQPLVLHRGRGVTAGYPIIAVVTSADLDRMGQVRPGDRVRFYQVSEDMGVRAYRKQFDVLESLGLKVEGGLISLLQSH